MRFVKVNKDEIERRQRGTYAFSHDIVSEVEKFLSMDVEAAKVVFDKDEYKGIKSAYGSLYRMVHHHKLPVRVRFVGDEIYLIRKDI